MKKIILFFLILILFSGCSKKEEVKEIKKEKEEVPVEEKEEVPTYQDQNNTPISFYQLQGNSLKKLDRVSNHYASLDDVGLFQIYFSNENNISLTNSFPTSYHDEFEKYHAAAPIKVGFSLSFTLKSGEEVFYNIFTPNNTMDKWEYFMAYLYDDYANQGKSYYSHIEPEEYQESSLFTAIKLQCGGYFDQVNSPVIFTVYTYDSEDDFLDGHYRGNSQASMTICMNDLC